MRSHVELAAHIDYVLNLAPRDEAIFVEGMAFSWQQLAEAISTFDEAFAGLSRGSQVGIVAHNRAATVAALAAVVRAGHCLVTLNPMHSGLKIGAELEALRLPLIVVGPDDLLDDSLASAIENNGNSVIVASDLRSGIELECRPGTKPSSSFGDPSEEVAILMQSSGTTGDPKRIPLQYPRLLHPITDQVPAEGAAAMQAKATPAIVASPLAHIGGLFFALKSLIDARPQILMGRFNVDLWVGVVREHELKLGHLVPATLKMILDADVPPQNLASLRAVICGSAALRPDIQKAFEEKYDVPVLVVYGATEFAGGVAGWTVPLHREFMPGKLGSVGRAFPGTALRVVDENSGEEVSSGEEGILEVCSVQSEAGSDRWLRTTDVATLDSDQFLWIRGRADAAINRGGFKVLPSDVEKVLQEYPDVDEAAVIALDDERLGQVPAALVQLKNQAQNFSVEALETHARVSLSKDQIPARFLVVDAIPRNASMKPDLPVIRSMFESKQ